MIKAEERIKALGKIRTRNLKGESQHVITAAITTKIISLTYNCYLKNINIPLVYHSSIMVI